MIDIAHIPLFAELSEAGVDEVRSAYSVRTYQAGGTIVRRGEPGRFLYAVATGAVSVRISSRQQRSEVWLGAGETFGEISLITGDAVSATVTAVRDTQIFVIPKATFETLFATEPSFRKATADVLAARLRTRTSDHDRPASFAFIVSPAPSTRLTDAIVRGVDHYARVSTINLSDDPHACVSKRLDDWRFSARSDEYCVVHTPISRVDDVRRRMRPEDVMLIVCDTGADVESLVGKWPVQHAAVVRTGPAAQAPFHLDRWSYQLSPSELAIAEHEAGWNRRRTPTLDSIARWISRRTVGLALGAGAARGHAHLGVLEVLETAGVPIDCMSGSSIGGIIALLYGLAGSAAGALELARGTIGSNAMIGSMRLLPRASVLSDHKVRLSAARVAGTKTFADLRVPTMVVATDLVGGARVVLDRGPIATALRATSAIPGVLPPVESEGRCLVDGGVVTRLPVDLLSAWRTGLRIGVSVLPAPDHEGDAVADKIRRAISAPFGMARVITRSLELMGYWHSAIDERGADLMIKPDTHWTTGNDFGAIRALADAGRQAAEEQRSEIVSAVSDLLRPRRHTAQNQGMMHDA